MLKRFPNIKGIISLSYPLVSGSGESRSLILKLIPTTISTLFVVGTKDKMCPMEKMKEALKDMKAPSKLVVVEGGDHSLNLPKRGALSMEGRDALVLESIKSFLDDCR